MKLIHFLICAIALWLALIIQNFIHKSLLLFFQILIIVFSLDLSHILLLSNCFRIRALLYTLWDRWKFLFWTNNSLLICNLTDRAWDDCRSFPWGYKISLADSVGALNCWVSLCCWVFFTVKVTTLWHTGLCCLTAISSSAVAFLTNWFA